MMVKLLERFHRKTLALYVHTIHEFEINEKLHIT